MNCVNRALQSVLTVFRVESHRCYCESFASGSILRGQLRKPIRSRIAATQRLDAVCLSGILNSIVAARLPCRIDATSAGSRDTAKRQIPNLPSEFTAWIHSRANSCFAFDSSDSTPFTSRINISPFDSRIKKSGRYFLTAPRNTYRISKPR